MLVMFQCNDDVNQQQKRIEALQAHLTWVEDNMENIKVAGPLLAPNTQTILGSMYVIDAENIDQAEQLFKQDPYYKANIWQHITITVFKDYAGTWVGGKNWPTGSNN